MSYQVIARKFRPARFADVVGQEVVTRTLMNALTLGRVAHAYLMSGTRGVGKTTTARLLAKCLNCERGLSPDPCDACASCQEVATGSSLDVLEIDGASNRGINEVRELRESARYAPARDRYKVFIIDEVHMLTAEAFNALLKIVEEPPPHVVFVLATTEREKVPPTILSRCQKLDFRRLGTDEIEGSLRRTAETLGAELDAGAVGALARAAEGSVRDAQSLLEQVLAYAGTRVTQADVEQVLGAVPRQLTLRALEAVRDQDGAAALSVVDELYRSGQDPRLFATTLLGELRNLVLLVASARKGASSSLPPEESERLGPLAEGRDMMELLRAAEVLARLDRELRLASIPRFALEVGLLELVEMRRLLPIEDLIARLGTGDAPASSPARSGPPAPAARPDPRPSRPAPPPAAPRRQAAVPDAGPGVAAGAPTGFLADARGAMGIRAGFLDDVAGVSAEDGVLTLALRAGASATFLAQPDVISILQAAAVPHFGAGLRIAVEAPPAAAAAPVFSGRAAPADVAAASDAPLVRKLLDIFQGDVASVGRPGGPDARSGGPEAR